MIRNTKSFLIGLVLALGFFGALGVMFSPLFGAGRNAFDASDQLFNSIAKGSSHYMPELVAHADAEGEMPFEVKVALKEADLATKAESILRTAGATVAVDGTSLTVSGSLTKLAKEALVDADAMFQNHGEAVRARYGLPEREALFVWWTALKEMQKALKFDGKGKEVVFLEEILLKGVEVGYNFYGIEARKASENAGILAGALLFYLVYTIWWGYAILYLFDGLGLQMTKAKKKEV